MARLLRQLVKMLPPVRRLIAQRDELQAAVKQLHGMRAPPGHFNSPIPSPEQVWANAAELENGGCGVLGGIQLREAEQRELFRALWPLAEELPFTAKPSPGRRYYYDNNWFFKHDALVLGAMLRHERPRRVIEVGSGFSSAAMLDVNDWFLDGATQFTFIDPNPARLESLLTAEDRRSATIHRNSVQAVPLTVFDELEASDVLFIDSSHVARVGSDVTHLLFKVLPRLKVGVCIHFHDVYFPFEYPPDWMLAGNYWNEAYLLRAFLQYNDAFRIELFSSWIWPRAGDARCGWPAADSQSKPTSLWLRRVPAERR